MKQTISSIANMFEIKSNVKEVGHATIQYSEYHIFTDRSEITLGSHIYGQRTTNPHRLTTKKMVALVNHRREQKSHLVIYHHRRGNGTGGNQERIK